MLGLLVFINEDFLPESFVLDIKKKILGSAEVNLLHSHQREVISSQGSFLVGHYS